MSARAVAVVEDDEAVRASIVAVLEGWGFEALAYADGESFLADAAAAGVACAVVDLRLPGMDGLAVLDALGRRRASPPAVVISAHGEVATAVAALRRGARDFVEKPFDAEELVARVRALSAGGAPPESGSAPAAGDALAALTRRERQVLALVAAGGTNKTVAAELGISPKTVEMHRARLMAKTRAQHVSDLVRLAVRAGIVE
ncbi:MAG: response regulator transcription factor [Paracoccaceae bacterium]